MTDDHPHHIEDQSAADAYVDAERDEFWRRIRAMSSAGYKPTRYGGAFARDERPGPPPQTSRSATRGYLDRQGR